MMNSRSGNLDATQSYHGYNNASGSNENAEEIILSDLGVPLWILVTGITLFTCCIGIVGNGCIIWLLGSQIKRNHFTTFIFHLAIADFGYLTTIFKYIIQAFTNFQEGRIFQTFWIFFSHLMYISSNFFLMAISVDWCVAVVFPIWHRCSQPKHLSSKVCILLWISSFLMSGIRRIINFPISDSVFHFHFLVTGIVSLPLITLSTAILFITMCLKPKQKNQGRLLLMILITLLCFLMLAFLLSVMVVIISFSSTKVLHKFVYLVIYSMLSSCLNSSINPVIYFLVGRKKGAQPKESMKVILQKVFREGKTTGGR